MLMSEDARKLDTRWIAGNIRDRSLRRCESIACTSRSRYLIHSHPWFVRFVVGQSVSVFRFCWEKYQHQSDSWYRYSYVPIHRYIHRYIHRGSLVSLQPFTMHASEFGALPLHKSTLEYSDVHMYLLYQQCGYLLYAALWPLEHPFHPTSSGCTACTISAQLVWH